MIAYIRFELRHETFFMVLNFSEQMFLICPVLSMRGQYLQVVVLQKLKPLCLFLGRGIVDGMFAVKSNRELNGLGMMSLLTLLDFAKKSVIDFCFGTTLVVEVVGRSTGMVGGT